jgi:hypothetical protein
VARAAGLTHNPNNPKLRREATGPHLRNIQHKDHNDHDMLTLMLLSLVRRFRCHRLRLRRGLVPTRRDIAHEMGGCHSTVDEKEEVRTQPCAVASRGNSQQATGPTAPHTAVTAELSCVLDSSCDVPACISGRRLPSLSHSPSTSLARVHHVPASVGVVASLPRSRDPDEEASAHADADGHLSSSADTTSCLASGGWAPPPSLVPHATKAPLTSPRSHDVDAPPPPLPRIPEAEAHSRSMINTAACEHRQRTVPSALHPQSRRSPSGSSSVSEAHDDQPACGCGCVDATAVGVGVFDEPPVTSLDEIDYDHMFSEQNSEYVLYCQSWHQERSKNRDASSRRRGSRSLYSPEASDHRSRSPSVTPIGSPYVMSPHMDPNLNPNPSPLASPTAFALLAASSRPHSAVHSPHFPSQNGDHTAAGQQTNLHCDYCCTSRPPPAKADLSSRRALVGKLRKAAKVVVTSGAPDSPASARSCSCSSSCCSASPLPPSPTSSTMMRLSSCRRRCHTRPQPMPVPPSCGRLPASAPSRSTGTNSSSRLRCGRIEFLSSSDSFNFGLARCVFSAVEPKPAACDIRV